MWENDHPKNEWKDYLLKAMTSAVPKRKVKCQRHEYPPTYFVLADTLPNPKTKNHRLFAGFRIKKIGNEVIFEGLLHQ